MENGEKQEGDKTYPPKLCWRIVQGGSINNYRVDGWHQKIKLQGANALIIFWMR